MPTLDEAITATVDGTLVTKWMVIAEVVAEDGNTYLETFVSKDMALWDQLGFLRFQMRFKEQMVEVPDDD